MFNRVSYADSFRFLLLEPGIRYLKEEALNRRCLDVIFHNLFRQMEMWKYNFSSLPQRGFIYDPGISETEATQMYEVLDCVFAAVFPAYVGIDRENAASHIEDLIRLARREVFDLQSRKGPSIYQLLQFMEKLLEALEKLAEKPVTQAA
jgi:hypothetical protein